MNYEIVVGLEVHAELSTTTKVFCSCKNTFGAEVNTCCCPSCMGMPGALPTLNEAVVEYAVKAGLAMNCHINPVSKFDRKNYFYPDLSKGYQTTQFDIPVCEHGYVDIITDEAGSTKRIRVNRIHIEEDTAKLIHDDSFDGTLIDFNRCGVPLIEIVSEPDLRSAADAKTYLDTLRAILVTIGVTDGKMQEGSIRSDVNVSVRPVGAAEFGTRVEMKNVSTFSGALRAIEFEAARQIAVLEAGGTISQETRRWDDLKGENFLMRSKEDAHDYRYFPEPDLLTLVVDDARIEELKQLPELPNAKTLRLMEQYALPLFDANLLVENPEKGDFFEEAAALKACTAKGIANWLLGDVSRILNENGQMLADTKLNPARLCEMIALIEKGTISSAAGKTVVEIILVEETSPADIVAAKGLAQISDNSALEAIAAQVLEQNPATIEQYRGGKTNVIGFLVGQCMKLSKGQGNPAALKEILLKIMEE